MYETNEIILCIKINIESKYSSITLYSILCLNRGFLHLVRTNNKLLKRRISDCSLFDEIDQVFGGYLTRRNIGSLICLYVYNVLH